jgi:hypothetical protein
MCYCNSFSCLLHTAILFFISSMQEFDVPAGEVCDWVKEKDKI